MTQAPDNPSRSLVEAFREMAERVHSSEDYEGTFRRISDTATETIRGCDAASISSLGSSGPVSHGVTDPLAARGDQIQYEEGEGPCLDAAMTDRWVYTPDMAQADRWPTSSQRLADELGVGSMFSCRLALDAEPHRTLGSINLYSLRKDAFSEEDQLLAILLSSLGAVVVDGSRQQASLRAAIESRQVIGEAIGILRARGNVTSEQAFGMLTQASQRMNIKLRVIAGRIAEHPDTPRAL